MVAVLVLFRYDLRGRSETYLVDYLVVSVLAAKLQVNLVSAYALAVWCPERT